MLKAVLAVDLSEWGAGERLRGYLRDQGYSANQVAAVVDSRPADIHLTPARLEAVRAFEQLPEAEALAELDERESARLPVGGDPQERELGRVARPRVEGVEGPVEARRHRQAEVPHGRGVVGHVVSRHSITRFARTSSADGTLRPGAALSGDTATTDTRDVRSRLLVIASVHCRPTYH